MLSPPDYQPSAPPRKDYGIGIVGCGGIGGILAAHLFEQGHDVTVLTTNPLIADAVNEHGFCVRGEGSPGTVRGRAVKSLPENAAPFDFVLLATQPGMAAPARKTVEDKAKAYRAEAERLKKDAEDGTDVLLAKAKELTVERDVALRKDPYFDWSQALIQIAIVLASVHLIIGNLMLLGLSGGLAGLGILLMLNGYTLLVRLPLLV